MTMYRLAQLTVWTLLSICSTAIAISNWSRVGVAGKVIVILVALGIITITYAIATTPENED